MSGRRFTTIAVAICLALVAYAFWQRTRSTQQVREFWGAAQASLIQHAPRVELREPSSSTWREISSAPGLVHLRATLVDDRYYRWSEQALQKEPASPDSVQLKFSRDTESIELLIDPLTGVVTNLESGQSVPLIPASQQAIAAYLKAIE